MRLSGVCAFKLPEKVSPGRLLVPACFHGTGIYLLDSGLTAPGLFRVTGSSTEVVTVGSDGPLGL